MKQITTYIPFWQELLEHKSGFSDMEIHQNIAKLYVNAVMDYEKTISYETGMDCCQKALEHIRKSYTASRESNDNRRQYEESIMPEGNCLEVCGATPGDPFLIEADIYFWMGYLCKKHGDNLLAYSYLTHAERMCRVSKIKNYHDVILGESELTDEDIDCEPENTGERCLYNWITTELNEVVSYIDLKSIDKNLPSKEFLYNTSWDEGADTLRPLIEHYQKLIERKDFYIYSEKRCYQILTELYLSYYYMQENISDRESLLEVAVGIFEKSLTASPFNTEKREDTIPDPWFFRIDGVTLKANMLNDDLCSEEHEVMLWADYYDVLKQKGQVQASDYAKEHAEFLDRIYFFERQNYTFEEGDWEFIYGQ